MGTMNDRKARLDELLKIVKDHGELTTRKLFSLVEYRWGLTNMTYESYLETLERAELVDIVEPVWDTTLNKWSSRLIKSK